MEQLKQGIQLPKNEELYTQQCLRCGSIFDFSFDDTEVDGVNNPSTQIIECPNCGATDKAYLIPAKEIKVDYVNNCYCFDQPMVVPDGAKVYIVRSLDIPTEEVHEINKTYPYIEVGISEVTNTTTEVPINYPYLTDGIKESTERIPKSFYPILQEINEVIIPSKVPVYINNESKNALRSVAGAITSKLHNYNSESILLFYKEDTYVDGVYVFNPEIEKFEEFSGILPAYTPYINDNYSKLIYKIE